MLVRMSSSREQIVRAEEEDRDSLGCSEDSLKDKTTVTAIGKVNQNSKLRIYPCIDRGKREYCFHGFVT